MEDRMKLHTVEALLLLEQVAILEALVMVGMDLQTVVAEVVLVYILAALAALV